MIEIGQVFAVFNIGLSTLALSSPIIDSSFALKCNGTAEIHNVGRSSETKTSETLSDQIFVVDQFQKIIFRALEPRQQFDPVCMTEDGQGNADISPGMIRTSSLEYSESGMTTECETSFNRKDGSGMHLLKFTYDDGTMISNEWQLICEPTSIPNFETVRNKF